MMKASTDQQIWNQLRNGSKKALQQIYDEHFSYLYNYGKKIFQDQHLVEDAIHDLFVDIWKRKEGLGETDSIRKYMAASLRRRIVADLKRQHKINPVESFERLDFQAELDIEQIIVGREINQEQAQKLKSAFDTLSARQKEVLYLRFYKGLDYEQISDVVGIKYQSLRNLISTGIKKLRSEMSFWLCLILHHLLF